MDTKSLKLVNAAMAYKYIGTVISCLVQYLLSRLTPTLDLQCGHSKDRLLRLKSEERKLIFLPQFGHVIGFLTLAIVHCLENQKRPSESFPTSEIEKMGNVTFNHRSSKTCTRLQEDALSFIHAQ